MNEYTLSSDGKIAFVSANRGRFFFIIDAEDLEKVKRYDWNVYLNKYSSGRDLYYVVKSNKIGPLYRYLLKDIYDIDGKFVDHKNLNTLDNRKANLRVCSHLENNCNRNLAVNNTSGVTGVRFYKDRNRYQARICIHKKIIILGYFKTLEEATQARNVGLECMFGEFGRYNDVPPAPPELRNKIIEKCRRFAEFSLNKAFFNKNELINERI